VGAGQFSVTFDAIVNVGGLPSIPVLIGATTRSAFYQSGSGTNVLTFSYTIQADDKDTDGITLGSSIGLNGGSLLGSGGLAANRTFVNVGATNGVLVNVNTPTLSITNSSSPFDNVQLLVVTFSEGVTGLSENDFILSTTGTVGATPILVPTGSSLVYLLHVVVSGSGSVMVSLPAGAVTNADGIGNIASNVLNVPIMQSADANLQNLIPSAGTLAPAFDPNTTSYTLNVANDVELLLPQRFRIRGVRLSSTGQQYPMERPPLQLIWRLEAMRSRQL
jgi:hypothetical protein